MTSCSGWMVATMSRIGPTRGRSISLARIALRRASASVRPVLTAGVGPVAPARLPFSVAILRSIGLHP
jgi:hypothetical protein